MKIQIIVQQEKLQKQNQDDPFLEFTHNINKLQYQPLTSFINPKKVFAIIGGSAILILCAYFLKFYLQAGLSKFSKVYSYETVGMPTVGSEFNLSVVQQSEKYQFQTVIASTLQPFNSTNCLLSEIEGALFCKNMANQSKAFVNFGRHSQKQTLGCKLMEQYKIAHYFYGCNTAQIDCQYTTKKTNNLCLSELSSTLFFTNYKSLRDTLLESGLQSEHIIMKLTLTANEWASFRSFPLQNLDLIDQIILQFDIQEAYLWGNIQILHSLAQKFYPVNLHMSNQYCRADDLMQQAKRKLQSSVFTVTLVNKQITELTANTRSFKANYPNRPIRVDQKDCQMPYQMHSVAVQPVQLAQITWDKQNMHQLTLQHVHPKTLYDQSTMGIPKPSANFNFQKLPQNDRVSYYNHIAQLFQPYTDSSCEYARYGDPNDQGYVICKNVIKQSAALLNFGIEGRDTFGCQISTEFSIPNLQYDCTNLYQPFCRTNNHGNHFYYACLGERSQTFLNLNRTYYSLKDIIDRHKLKQKHITLKIDIEAGQWVSFRSFPVSYLQYVDQIIIEFHLFENFGYFKGNFDILNSLKEKFYPVNFHQNNYNCWRRTASKLKSSVFQVTLVNKNALQLYSQKRQYSSHTLNRPNRKNSPDCQMSASE